MGSKASKAERTTRENTKAVSTPGIPHDIINEILDYLASTSDFRSLRACALVSKSWVQPCRHRLFHTAVFTPASTRKWLKRFPVREASPAHHVREMRLKITHDVHIRRKFFERMPWFTNVDKISLSGLGYGEVPLGHVFSPPLEPSFWKLPRSATSLDIGVGAITLVRVRDMMAQLPNLDNLVLSASISDVVGRRFPGIGTVLKGRFSGRLIVRDPGEGIVNMLSEIPSGLHFTELYIHCTVNPFPSPGVRLAEACCKTLVKLSHIVDYNCKSYPFSGYFYCEKSTLTPSPDRHSDDTFESSFDLSKFPNVQDVSFCLWHDISGRGLPWIPMALSTLRPTTSPRLSVIKLSFHPSVSALPGTMITGMGSDLRRIADEVARIEREFEGRVNFTIDTYSPHFRMVLDDLNVRFHGRNFVVMLIHFRSSLTGPPALVHCLGHGGCLARSPLLVSRACRRSAHLDTDFSIPDTPCTLQAPRNLIFFDEFHHRLPIRICFLHPVILHHERLACATNTFNPERRHGLAGIVVAVHAPHLCLYQPRRQALCSISPIMNSQEVPPPHKFTVPDTCREPCVHGIDTIDEA